MALLPQGRSAAIGDIEGLVRCCGLHLTPAGASFIDGLGEEYGYDLLPLVDRPAVMHVRFHRDEGWLHRDGARRRFAGNPPEDRERGDWTHSVRLTMHWFHPGRSKYGTSYLLARHADVTDVPVAGILAMATCGCAHGPRPPWSPWCACVAGV